MGVQGKKDTLKVPQKNNQDSQHIKQTLGLGETQNGPQQALQITMMSKQYTAPIKSSLMPQEYGDLQLHAEH